MPGICIPATALVAPKADRHSCLRTDAQQAPCAASVRPVIHPGAFRLTAGDEAVTEWLSYAHTSHFDDTAVSFALKVVRWQGKGENG